MIISPLKNHKSGFTLVEVLIASAIISLILFALISAAQQGIRLSYNALKQTQANSLLEEGAEAVKSIRDKNWSTISSITLDTNYYLSYDTSTNIWSLGTTPVGVVDAVFTRTVSLSQVLRDATDDIAGAGTLDARTKKVTINVSWPISDGTTQSKNLIFYIADIFN
jgi:prepilin-type N-terminal cleavage/methylation domain-containing protein